MLGIRVCEKRQGSVFRPPKGVCFGPIQGVPFWFTIPFRVCIFVLLVPQFSDAPTPFLNV